MKKQMNCKVCNILFSYKYRPNITRKCCSPKCRQSINRKVKLSCKTCKKDFLVFPSRSHRMYCIKECWSNSKRREHNPDHMYATEEKIRIRLKMLYLERVTMYEDKCWEWIGNKDKDGYGVFTHNRKVAKAHRVSWTIHNGDIPPDTSVLHTCDNPPCSNYQHLFLGTQLDNIKDMVKKGRNTSSPR